MRPFRLPAEYQHAILDHELTGDHRRAVILMIHWLDLLPNLFPLLRNRPDPSKDPRKTHLFKCCLKAVQTLGPKFQEENLRLFAKAQLQILRAVEGAAVVVTPECLCGVMAKKRWEIWQSKVAKKSTGLAAATRTEDVSPDLGNVVGNLKNSHRFVQARGGLKGLMGSPEKISRWVKTKMIDPLYVFLHPDSQPFAKIQGWAVFGVDTEVVGPMATQVVRNIMAEFK